MYLFLVKQSLYILFLEKNNNNKLYFKILFFCNKPGATRISCFLVRIRKKTSSFVGSISRIAERALSDKDFINAAYC